MIYPYTAALHGVMAMLCFASLVYLFYQKRDAASQTIRAYFNWFLFFFLYNVFLVLPLLAFKELNLYAGLSYNLALLFVALGAWQAFRVALNITVPEPQRKIISALYIGGAVLAAFLHFAFPEIPAGTPDGRWVLWYSNQPRSLFFSIFMFLAGWTFAWPHLSGLRSLPSNILRIRALLFALGGFILPFAAFYYFGAQKVEHIYLAFLFSIIGLVFFALGNIVIGLAKKT